MTVLSPMTLPTLPGLHAVLRNVSSRSIRRIYERLCELKKTDPKGCRRMLETLGFSWPVELRVVNGGGR